ncbi:Hypothetical Protein FCC1311_046132 [Hondaea fermentalgiana]|uniref:Uncharacterized protein n=1 Tax=Hondaea fermentalgiana TaxID=2315210 RepID=A0A2R5GBM6_9STRA|nr:Hypothetical Protein FCC1311_046132 [Hondaea fermentalgiana]|eukprot:GBG28390.1 Hypothetical Protein FCC1311_046132 [Hondaea fermentalgiana]
MGSGASTFEEACVDPDHPSLSKKEIRELYDHLSAEYTKKVDELVKASAHAKEAAENNIEYIHDEEFTEDEEDYAVDGSYAETANDMIEENGEESPREPISARSPLGAERRKLYTGKDVQRKLMEIVIEDQPRLLNMKVKVNTKALGLLGDESLDAGARKYVADGTKITPKVLGKLGCAFIMPEKAAKRLGDEDMTRSQRLAMMRAEEKEARERADAKRAEIERILELNPEDDPRLADLSLKQRVSTKAFEKLGGSSDEKLMENVRNQVTKDTTISKKTIQLTGDDKLLPKKIMERRGSEMHADQIQAMKRAEAKAEKDRQKQSADNLNQVLSKDATGSMMIVPSEVKGNPKLLEMAGEAAFLPEKANKVLGDEMSPQQRRRMLDAERKSESFNSNKS